MACLSSPQPLQLIASHINVNDRDISCSCYSCLPAMIRALFHSSVNIRSRDYCWPSIKQIKISSGSPYQCLVSSLPMFSTCPIRVPEQPVAYVNVIVYLCLQNLYFGTVQTVEYIFCQKTLRITLLCSATVTPQKHCLETNYIIMFLHGLWALLCIKIYVLIDTLRQNQFG